MIQPIQNTNQYSLKSFDLHYYFDNDVKSSFGKLYNDDGETSNAFEKGMYEVVNFNSIYNRNRLSIKINTEQGANYITSSKTVNLVIHNISKKPKRIKGFKYTWNEITHTVTISVLNVNTSEKLIKINF